MTSFLLIVQVVLVILLTIVVLLQKSSSIGLGAYSGSNESVFGAKGPGSFLAKTTFFLGFLFIANTIALGYFYAQAANKSVVDEITTPVSAPAPSAAAAETAPVAPTAESAAPSAPSAAPVESAAPAVEANASH